MCLLLKHYCDIFDIVFSIFFIDTLADAIYRFREYEKEYSQIMTKIEIRNVTKF